MDLRRRTFVAACLGATTGLAGCEEPLDPTVSDPTSSVSVAEGTVEFELDEGSLHGRIAAEDLSSPTAADPSEFDPETGNYDLDDGDEHEVEFEPGTLSRVTAVADEGTVDLFYRGDPIAEDRAQVSESFPPADGTTLERFDACDLSAYTERTTGDEDFFGIAATAYQGECALNAESFAGPVDSSPLIYRRDVTVAPGDTVRVGVNPSRARSDPNFVFGVSGPNTWYRVNVNDTSEYTIYRNEDGEKSTLASGTGSIPRDWHEWTVDWSEDGERIALTATGTTVEATDPDPLPSGGIGWLNTSPRHECLYDSVVRE